MEIDYQARLAQARARMEALDIGLLYLQPGANLFYLTGLPTRDEYRTDHNRYGDYVVGGYLGLEEGVSLVAARMGGSYFVDQVADKPWFRPVRLILETETPARVAEEVLDRFDLRGRKVALDDHAWAESLLTFRHLLPEVEFVLASDVIAPLRMIKQEVEIERMRRAGEIAGRAFERALERMHVGVSVFDVEHEIDYQLRVLGASYNSFVTDVAFAGPIHVDERAPATEVTLLPGDAVMFDLGCVYRGYCSDFGRSAFVGEPPVEYERMHALVLEAQGAAMAAMKAGQITAAEANEIARAVIEGAGYGPNFTHRLGHGIGVTVHERPFLDVTDETVLQANMTFTVEPSIRPVAAHPIEGGYANRVEDVVRVTPEGAVSLYETDHRIYVIE
jgi:Xaa-Pro aminopeptidase